MSLGRLTCVAGEQSQWRQRKSLTLAWPKEPCLVIPFPCLHRGNNQKVEDGNIKAAWVFFSFSKTRGGLGLFRPSFRVLLIGTPMGTPKLLLLKSPYCSFFVQAQWLFFNALQSFPLSFSLWIIFLLVHLLPDTCHVIQVQLYLDIRYTVDVCWLLKLIFILPAIHYVFKDYCIPFQTVWWMQSHIKYASRSQAITV